MKYLIFGKKGWLAQRFNEFLEDSEISKVDITDLNAIKQELDKKKPEVVINAAGKTGRPNIDWCEENDIETLVSNVIGPRKINAACEERNIYWVHLSSGCIFQGDNDGKGWKEEDIGAPPSWYSWTKDWSDQYLKDKPVLIVRFRLPIDDRSSPRNLINKLLPHPKVRNIDNSVTVVPDLLKTVKELAEKKLTGIYHVVNPGTINSGEIMTAYKKIVDPNHKFGIISEDEYYGKVAGVRRADCLLNTDKLKEQGIHLKPIKERIIEVMKEYKKNL